MLTKITNQLIRTAMDASGTPYLNFAAKIGYDPNSRVSMAVFSRKLNNAVDRSRNAAYFTREEIYKLAEILFKDAGRQQLLIAAYVAETLATEPRSYIDQFRALGNYSGIRQDIYLKALGFSIVDLRDFYAGEIVLQFSPEDLYRAFEISPLDLMGRKYAAEFAAAGKAEVEKKALESTDQIEDRFEKIAAMRDPISQYKELLPFARQCTYPEVTARDITEEHGISRNRVSVWENRKRPNELPGYGDHAKIRRTLESRGVPEQITKFIENVFDAASVEKARRLRADNKPGAGQRL